MNFCGSYIDEKYKTDCYFYHEEHDMGARIDFCAWHNKMDELPCQTCKCYLDKKEASKIIWQYMRKKQAAEAKEE